MWRLTEVIKLVIHQSIFIIMKIVNTRKFWAWYFNTPTPEASITVAELMLRGFGEATFNYGDMEISLTEPGGTPVTTYHVRNAVEFFGLISAMCFLGEDYDAKMLVGKYRNPAGEDIRCMYTTPNGRKLSFCLPLLNDWDELKPQTPQTK